MQSSINTDEEGKLTQRVFVNQNKNVFLDYFADGAKEVWGEGLRDLYQ